MTSDLQQFRPPQFETVYSGALGVAKTVQATLESAGFSTFIPQENMKTLDPFNTGANCLTVAVQVSSNDAEAVREFLENATKRALVDSDDEQGTVDCEAIVLSTRIAWAFALQWIVLGLPWPWLFAPRYFRIVAESPDRPLQHTRTVAVLIASALLTLGSALILQSMIG